MEARAAAQHLPVAIDDLIKDMVGLQRPIQAWDLTENEVAAREEVQQDVLCTKDEENCFPIVKNYSK